MYKEELSDDSKVIFVPDFPWQGFSFLAVADQVHIANAEGCDRGLFCLHKLWDEKAGGEGSHPSASEKVRMSVGKPL